MPLLFVYGTLKRGCKNHRMMAGQRFVAEASTGPGWALHHLGDYPGLVAASSRDTPVPGELWEVDAETMGRLDRFEGVNEGLYRRTPLAVFCPERTLADTYIYLRDCAGRPLLERGWQE